MTPSAREADEQKVRGTFCRPNAREAGRSNKAQGESE